MNWPVFDVTSYGAIPDDGMSDKAAIKAAIAAAESNGMGVIYFPPGRFDINKPDAPWSNDIIRVSSSHIVFRGSGSGVGGTELYGERHMDPTDPAKFWTCPAMIQFRGSGLVSSKQSAVVSDSERETFSVTVSNASDFATGDWVQLTRSDTSTPAVAESVWPYPVNPLWTSLINNGVQVREFHQIANITSNTLTFATPVHADVEASGNWSVILLNVLEEVGIEDIAFTGGWTSNFVHHGSYHDDSGWTAVQYSRVVNSWMRDCRFNSWSMCAKITTSANITASRIRIEGNKGHNGLTFNASSHCLAFDIDDVAGQHHASGVAGSSSGNVFLRCNYEPTTCYEAHAAQPRCTLMDNISGGWMYGRWGGAVQNLPNHLRHLVFWNYENTGTGESGDYEFMRSSSDHGKIIMPYLIGFHGNPQNFDESMVERTESHGARVLPDSLYEAQYQHRTSNTFAQLQYSEWAAGHGITGPAADLQADPDSDGRNNLYEYAAGGNPAAGTNETFETPQLRLSETGGLPRLEYEFPRRHNWERLGLSYSVEGNTNLLTGNWTNVPDLSSTEFLDEELESVTRELPIGTSPRHYFRFRVDLNQ